MGLERMTCCGVLTAVYRDAGNRTHSADCPGHAMARHCRVEHFRWGTGTILRSDWQNPDEWVVQWDNGMEPWHYLPEHITHVCRNVDG